MATLLHKSKIMKVAGLSLVVLLAACSSDQRYKRQVSGDESYLETAGLKNLAIPAGMVLPLQNGEYDIPTPKKTEPVGLALDIRPPTQALNLLSGSRSENNADNSRLLLPNSPENTTLYEQINTILKEKGVAIAQSDAGQKEIHTDWITWLRADENVPFQTRQRLVIAQSGNVISLTVTNEGLRQGETEVTDPSEVKRYNILMLNELVDGLNRMRNLSENTASSSLQGIIDVQSGSDNAGLPVIIVRAPFDVVWDRLPIALESVGMKMGDRTRSKGSIEVTYKGMSSANWSSLGVDRPTVEEADYKLQVGDLNNRSSLQFISDKGKPLTQSQNDQMVAALKAAFSKPVK
ncbi:MULTISPECIES: outer membrane protein assembly factor BamC [Enterobacterales]|uniref:outer membrane protein assembly factor BamC n=1 Tax=Enterobacterales TaxID=91347 RepID=UPI0008480B53|nr:MULTISPECIES: outer membrane protein assembly factor BamC [Enterobacterales]WOO48306.1 outer membrane protein assembly factor BamC [Hafnia alvei]MCK9781590.1 outer membrane protein assembly factor BamC [Proteus columbae]MCT6518260.1 outer membrane protein assembly factor BamC [Proteus vulgaris]ODQ05180.1 outer membrane protein assembly factor BamC [Shigella sp. FC130]OEI92631.1 outer membrane protein assembly factor BamC [Shigella sp. FC1655]